MISREALVKLSFRIVPGQDPEEILELAAEHLRQHCPDACRIEIEKGHLGPAYVMDPQSNYGKAAQTALEKTFGSKTQLIREGGSIPIISSIQDVLGVDTLMLGLALPDAQCHAPNENFPVENFEAGIRLNRILLEELSRM